VSFKVVAGFYFIAIAVFIFFWERFKGQSKIIGIIKKEMSIGYGFLISLIIPLAYFLSTGRLAQYLEWTYYYPLFKYPLLLFWLNKLYTKLLWFWVILILAFALSMIKNARKTVYLNPNNWLAISMGLFLFIPLLKSQASHCLFPGAAFLSIYIASALGGWLKKEKIMRNKLPFSLLLIIMSVIFGLSIYLYRPDALKRLYIINDYSNETAIKSAIQKIVPKDKKILVSDPLLYWISERYPNLPFFNFDYVQSSYWIEEHPRFFLDALRDPKLVLIESGWNSIAFYDQGFMKDEKNIILMGQFKKLLEKYFTVYDLGISGYTFWIRRDGLKL
jgi:hypothetical protein